MLWHPCSWTVCTDDRFLTPSPLRLRRTLRAWWFVLNVEAKSFVCNKWILNIRGCMLRIHIVVLKQSLSVMTLTICYLRLHKILPVCPYFENFMIWQPVIYIIIIILEQTVTELILASRNCAVTAGYIQRYRQTSRWWHCLQRIQNC